MCLLVWLWCVLFALILPQAILESTREQEAARMKELEKRQVHLRAKAPRFCRLQLNPAAQIETEKHMAQKRAEKLQITEQQVRDDAGCLLGAF